jgi:hypothetical protein
MQDKNGSANTREKPTGGSRRLNELAGHVGTVAANRLSP